MSERYRPSLRESLHNWSYSEEPFLRKVRLVARNEWKKLRTLRNCCGNIGEPGC